MTISKKSADLTVGRQVGIFFDKVPLKIFVEHYRVEVRPCTKADIVEIDTFSELKAIDKVYDF